MLNTNSWNKIRYTLYAPGYDLVGRIFANSRKKSIDLLDIQTEDKILIVGAGTGLDLEFIPRNCSVFATDITPLMIELTIKKNKKCRLNLQAEVMDGQKLSFENQTFDKIILHLILAVIPDPVACIKEAERVLKPGGSIVIFDKFVPRNQKISFTRKLFNPLFSFLFSDITRSIEPLIGKTELTIIEDFKADFGGNFRILQISKPT